MHHHHHHRDERKTERLEMIISYQMDCFRNREDNIREGRQLGREREREGEGERDREKEREM